MDLTNKYKRVPLDQITVKRDERQRREIKVEDLVDSIRRYGVMSPIIITRDLVLVAGERRLTASRLAGWTDIPCRFIEDLNPIEAQLLELEENVRRSDLPWRDACAATAKIHKIYTDLDQDWTQTKTAEALGMSKPHLTYVLRVATELESPKIANATGLLAAYNILSRADDRKIGDAIGDIISAGADMFKSGEPAPSQDGEDSLGPSVKTNSDSAPIVPEPPTESIFNLDFLEWAPKYSGRPFNFIHCDFPYGINAFNGAMSGKDKWETYNDDPDVYWALISCLCKNLDKLMAHSGHLMFWFSMEHYTKTIETFAKLAPTLNFSAFPLIWLKSDNVGVLPDPQRGPRRIYETALVASREDRLIVRAVSNAYAAPTDKAHHPSTKPEPVLRHFFRMYVDESTRMLDPTCGGGSAIRAAESLGAELALGLELSKEHYESARSALNQFRIMRKVAK